MITLRPMTAGDIPAGLSLCRLIGWNQLSRDWELFLKLSPEGCRVAVDEDEKVVGTVTTVCYEDHFSWIGMVLVDPARQQQGIGTQLMQEALKILESQSTVKLDATPAGREVYLKLGFKDEYPLTIMKCPYVAIDRLSDSKARLILENDLETIAAFDYSVFGADRKTILYDLWKRGPELCYWIEENNVVKAYCLGRSGHNYLQVGPIVCSELANAIEVASAALKKCGKQPVIVDALHHTPEWMSWLSSIGFTELRSLTRMYKGTNDWPGLPEHQFAILGPEFG
jgi:Acetyltransferase (GNAT) domain/Acetyltransferase (GNAT) family